MADIVQRTSLWSALALAAPASTMMSLGRRGLRAADWRRSPRRATQAALRRDFPTKAALLLRTITVNQ